MQIRPYGLLAYNRREYHYKPGKKDRPLKEDNDHSNKFTTDGHGKQYTGQLTSFSKRKLKRAIQLLVASAKEKEAKNFKTGNTFKFKVNFVTLTLPAPQGNITDKDLKKGALDPWIKRMRRKYKLNNYVWRAERQKNGNLHFHMITDTYIRFDYIRNDWNDCLKKFGFIKVFKKKWGHENPNSTDVHAVWKVRNLTQYFIKYMTKEGGKKDVINGKLWDCSKALKTKKNCEVLMEGKAEKVWNDVLADSNVKLKNEENFAIAFMNQSQMEYYLKGELWEQWQEYLKEIREGNNEDSHSIVNSSG